MICITLTLKAESNSITELKKNWLTKGKFEKENCAKGGKTFKMAGMNFQIIKEQSRKSLNKLENKQIQICRFWSVVAITINSVEQKNKIRRKRVHYRCS